MSTGAEAMSAPVPVLVFARAPRPGHVKRRLIPVLGAAEAARLQRRMTRRAVQTALAAATGPVQIWCTPRTAHPFFVSLGEAHGVALHAQRGADLGARMAHALETGLATHGAALLVGSDCPFMTPADLRRGAACLRAGSPAVLGPALDGGYFLIGLARPAPELFRGLRWGGAEVLAETRRRLRALGWAWTELPARRDIDRPADLPHLESLADW